MGSRKLLGGLAAAVLLLVIGGGAFWYFVIRDDAPEKATLAGAIDSIGTSVPASPGAGSTPGAAAASATTGATTTSASPGLAGTWVPDTAKETFVGYRVVEELARVGTATAVGRTSGVTGTVVMTANSLQSAKITADMTTLKSDSGMRDGQLRNQGIEYSKFPTATFEVTEAMPLPEGLASGQAVKTTLKGKLTLHGVTKDVQVPVEAQLKDGLLVVVGNIDIKFADYAINKPQGASVLSIEDHGLMELQLILKKG
ncbi:MAG: YceI family protein [Dehalococcoidia bacterium]|nr:YceI family protein [Dehalococcoidia bacterium]